MSFEYQIGLRFSAGRTIALVPKAGPPAEPVPVRPKINRYKIVWYHPSVVYEKAYVPTLKQAKTIANELLTTRMPVVKPKGVNILRRNVLKHDGIPYVDWVPVASFGSVPV